MSNRGWKTFIVPYSCSYLNFDNHSDHFNKLIEPFSLKRIVGGLCHWLFGLPAWCILGVGHGDDIVLTFASTPHANLTEDDIKIKDTFLDLLVSFSETK